jgi:hypothetical protein
MKNYFSRITADHWCAKNKLEKAAHKAAKEMDRRLVPDWQVKAYKEEFKEKILKINNEHPRCKPVELLISAGYTDRGDIDFYISGVFQMSLFLATS